MHPHPHRWRSGWNSIKMHNRASFVKHPCPSSIASDKSPCLLSMKQIKPEHQIYKAISASWHWCVRGNHLSSLGTEGGIALLPFEQVDKNINREDSEIKTCDSAEGFWDREKAKLQFFIYLFIVLVGVPRDIGTGSNLSQRAQCIKPQCTAECPSLQVDAN